MSRVVRLVSALFLALGSSMAIAIGQLWLADRTGVLNWRACFCDAGGDESYRFIPVFIIWFQAMAVMAGAVLGRLTLRDPWRPLWALAGLSIAAAAGAFAGVPVADAGREAATIPNMISVSGYAITGMVLGAVGAMVALKYSVAAASAGFCWIWFWAVGLASTFDNGDYTPSLGIFYSGSGRFYGHAESNHYGLGVLETFGPPAGMMVIAATVAWWGTRRSGRRSAGLFAALFGPALVFAAYMSVGPGNENAEPWGDAYSLLVLGVTAAAAGAAACAWRQTRRSWWLDALIIAFALAGVANEVLADLFPISRHYRDGGESLSLLALLLLLFLPPVADIWQMEKSALSGTEDEAMRGQ